VPSFYYLVQGVLAKQKFLKIIGVVLLFGPAVAGFWAAGYLQRRYTV